MSDLNLYFWHRTELYSVWNDVFIFLENHFRMDILSSNDLLAIRSGQTIFYKSDFRGSSSKKSPKSVDFCGKYAKKASKPHIFTFFTKAILLGEGFKLNILQN